MKASDEGGRAPCCCCHEIIYGLVGEAIVTHMIPIITDGHQKMRLYAARILAMMRNMD